MIKWKGDRDGYTGLLSWQSVPVEHCADAYGLVIRHESGWSMVYSGDSRPCRRLQEAGRGCTLLVHEATFEPALHFQVLPDLMVRGCKMWCVHTV